MATVSITGIGPTYRVPGGYAEIYFNQGPASGASGPRTTCVFVPKASSGTATVNTRYEILNSAHMATLGGTGYPGDRFANAFFKAKGGKLYAVFYAETATGSPVGAVITITVSGSITGSGTAHIVVCGEDCSYVYTSTDTVDTIATGLRAAINAKSWLPVAATGSTSAVVITARCKGENGNRSYKVRTYLDGTGGAALGTDGDLISGAEGTTTELAGLTAALAAVATTGGIYYLCTTTNAADCLAAMKTAISARSEPSPGLRSVGIAANRSGLATATVGATAIANGLNYERMQLVWQEDSDHDPATLVGQIAAIRAKRENTDCTYNFAGYGGRGEGDWSISPAYDDTDWPSATEQNTAINEGITCIASDTGRSYIAMSVNTRAKTGSVYDFRSTETHRISGCDEFTSRALTRWSGMSAGKKLRNDEFLPDGTVNPNQTWSRTVIKPSQVRSDVLVRTLREMESEDHLQEVDKSIESLICQKSTVTAGRIEAQVDLHVIDHAHQFVMRANEVTPG